MGVDKAEGFEPTYKELKLAGDVTEAWYPDMF